MKLKMIYGNIYSDTVILFLEATDARYEFVRDIELNLIFKNLLAKIKTLLLGNNLLINDINVIVSTICTANK